MGVGEFPRRRSFARLVHSGVIVIGPSVVQRLGGPVTLMREFVSFFGIPRCFPTHQPSCFYVFALLRIRHGCLLYCPAGRAFSARRGTSVALGVGNHE